VAQGRVSGFWLALWVFLAGAPVRSDAPPPAPGLVLSGADWSLPIGPAEVEAVEVFAAEGGGVALLATLRAGAAEALVRLAADGARVRLADADGATIDGGVSAAGGARRVLAAFADPADAQRAARRLLGQE
jgi:hypothetical protein